MAFFEYWPFYFIPFKLIMRVLPNKTKPRLWCDITFHTLILTLRYIIVCTCWVIHQTQADLEKVEVVYRTITPIRQGWLPLAHGIGRLSRQCGLCFSFRLPHRWVNWRYCTVYVLTQLLWNEDFWRSILFPLRDFHAYSLIMRGNL